MALGKPRHNIIVLPVAVRLGLLVLLVPISVVFFNAGKMLLAYMYFSTAQEWIHEFSERSSRDPAYRISRNDYHNTLTKSEAALGLCPSNSDYLLQVAAIHDWFSMHGDKHSPEKYKARKQATDYYRKVVEMRPRWASGWLYLAAIKARQFQFDREFIQSITTAQELGRWSSEVQSRIINITQPHEKILVGRLGAVMEQNWKNALQIQRIEAIRLAKTFHIRDRICGYVSAPLPGACLRD